MEYLVSGWAASVYATGWLVFFLGAAVSSGAFFLRGTGFKELSGGEGALFSAAAGLALLSLAVWAAGLLGLLKPASPAILGLLFYLPAVFSSDVRRLLLPRYGPWTPLTALAAVVCALSWAQATMPPTAADGLSYHLTHPKMFLEEGRLFAVPYAREALWPYLAEMLFLLALPAAGTMLATLFHWLFFVLTAWALSSFGSRYVSPGAGRLAALLWLFTPGAFAQSGQPYVDLAFSFYFFLGFYAFFLYGRTGQGRYAWLLGVFTGAALGVKYLALGAAALWAALLVWQARKAKPLLLFFAGAALVGGGWYLRSWLVLGNPVYPFFHSVFGSGLASDIGLEGMGTGWMDFLRLPWSVTLHPQSFGGDILGPFALWAFPALFLLFFRPGRWKALALAGIVFTAFIFTQSQNTRFFLAVVPWACLGAAALLNGFLWGKGLLRWATAAALAAVFAAHLGIYAFRTREAWTLLSGRQSAAQYLEKYDRSRKGYEYLEGVLKPGERVFNAAEAKFFYARLPKAFIQDNGIFRAAQKEGFPEHLKRQRYEYLWVESTFNRDVAAFAEANGYEKAFEYSFVESPQTYHYRIYRAR